MAWETFFIVSLLVASTMVSGMLAVIAYFRPYRLVMDKVLSEHRTRLKVMEESRRRMFVNISHDLRLPVSSALSNTELLLTGITFTPQQEQKYLKEIRSQLLGMTRLVQDIFQLSKIECFELNFQMREMSLTELVSNIYDKYFLDVKNAGLELKLDVAISSDIQFYADADRIDQVFGNLIANAVRQTGKGGQIIIHCELLVVPSSVPGVNGVPQILFKVADTGAGITPEDIPHVFERFYQANKACHNVAENSGLGLAIAKSIIGRHRGSIWVDELEAHGCTICFTLPVSSSAFSTVS